jgi:hypothetical protein
METVSGCSRQFGLCLVVAGSFWFVIIPKSKDRFMERAPIKIAQP